MVDDPKVHTFPFLEDSMIEKLSFKMADLGDGDHLRALLEEYGFCVIHDVASPDELKRLQGLFGRDLASMIDTQALSSSCPSSSPLIKQIERCLATEPGKATPEDEEFLSRFSDLWPTGSRVGGRAFAIGNGLPQGQFAWGCRSNPNIRKVFAAIHSIKEEDLCVGLDTVFYTNPALSQAQESNKLWPHADLNLAVPHSGEWPVFQSILYVHGSNEDNGLSTTVIWPKSHKSAFPTIMADEGIKHRGETILEHYSPISDMKNREAAHELNTTYLQEARRIPVPRGSLLVWSSRTVHQGHAGGRRLAFPVCWEPRERRDEETLRRKIRMVLMGFASAHSAALGQKHPHQPIVHQIPDSSEEEDLKPWVEYVEAKMGKEGMEEGWEFCTRFDKTKVPRKSRIAPGCLREGKGGEYVEVEGKVAKEAEGGFVGVDGDKELIERIGGLFNEWAVNAL